MLAEPNQWLAAVRIDRAMRPLKEDDSDDEDARYHRLLLPLLLLWPHTGAWMSESE
jgi:hypothetical protein